MRIKWARLDGRSGHEVGRQLLRELYREETGEDCPEILTESRGKPCFKDSSVHFSISHTKNHAFCCLSRRNIGLDAEEMDRKVSPALVDKILSASEKPRCADPGAVLRLWVLKEAYAKLTGKGLGNYLYETDFDPADPRVMIIDGCYVAILEEKENAV